jgi:hypothetical protein
MIRPNWDIPIGSLLRQCCDLCSDTDAAVSSISDIPFCEDTRRVTPPDPCRHVRHRARRRLSPQRQPLFSGNYRSGLVPTVLFRSLHA